MYEGLTACVSLQQFTCGHFKKANEWLKENYGEGHEIDWDLNVPVEKAGI